VAYRELLDGVPKDRVRGTNWYDRNPKIIAAHIEDLDIAPHAYSVVKSYTVPANRAAMLEHISLVVTRSVAAGTVGRARAAGNITVDGVTTIFMKAILFKNQVGDQSSEQMGTSVMLLAGNTITIGRGDSSTGGKCDYNCSYKLTEFDV